MDQDLEVRAPLQETELAALRRRLAVLEERDQEWQFLFNIIAHDLKEPLLTLEGFTKLLGGSGSFSSEQARYLAVLREAIDSLQMMVDSLQSIPKLHQKERKLSELSLNALWGSVINALSAKIQKTKAKVELPPEDLSVMGDALALHHVFLNLLTNSLKFHKKNRAPLVKIRYKTAQDFYEVSIEDNGVGIDAKDLEKIFTPYKRLDEAIADGFGLGLSIIRRIVDSLGGTVNVESSRMNGSIFRVRLPQQDKVFNTEARSQQRRPS